MLFRSLEMALGGGRKPEIFHSDQGCQFTSGDFVARLQAEEIRISWSGRKRCYDNILVERLWRTVKYEEVYLRAYSDGWEAEISLVHDRHQVEEPLLQRDVGDVRGPDLIHTRDCVEIHQAGKALCWISWNGGARFAVDRP